MKIVVKRENLKTERARERKKGERGEKLQEKLLHTRPLRSDIGKRQMSE